MIVGKPFAPNTKQYDDYENMTHKKKILKEYILIQKEDNYLHGVEERGE